MANEQKEQQSDQTAKKPEESEKDEISQEELSTVTGGFRPKHDGE